MVTAKTLKKNLGTTYKQPNIQTNRQTYKDNRPIVTARLQQTQQPLSEGYILAQGSVYKILPQKM